MYNRLERYMNGGVPAEYKLGGALFLYNKKEKSV